MTQGYIGQPHNEVIMSRYQKNERLKMSVFLREMIVDIDRIVHYPVPCTLYAAAAHWRAADAVLGFIVRAAGVRAAGVRAAGV